MDEKECKRLEGKLQSTLPKLTVRSVKHEGYWYIEIHDWSDSK